MKLLKMIQSLVYMHLGPLLSVSCLHISPPLTLIHSHNPLEHLAFAESAVKRLVRGKLKVGSHWESHLTGQVRKFLVTALPFPPICFIIQLRLRIFIEMIKFWWLSTFHGSVESSRLSLFHGFVLPPTLLVANLHQNCPINQVQKCQSLHLSLPGCRCQCC